VTFVRPAGHPEPTGRTGALLFATALALGIAVRTVDFLNCRSLGLDEARLAVNIVGRSFAGLLSPLSMDQSAPPLFLWTERLAVVLLGPRDCMLRILPVAAGIAVVILMYPFAARLLKPSEARLAAMIVGFCPLMITYSNAVKQYSVEALTAIAFLLAWDRALTGKAERRSMATLLVAGAVAPWLSLTSVFFLLACWIDLVVLALRKRVATRVALMATIVWGLSCAAAYMLVYRAASQNAYLRRFWELAFLTPTRSGFLGTLWRTLEDLVWGFVAGDPLVDRRPFLMFLHLGTVLVLVICSLGVAQVWRANGIRGLWWLCGGCLLTLGASMLGAFPIAPRLVLFVLPSLIVLFVAGLSATVSRSCALAESRALSVLGGVLILLLAAKSVIGVLELEPPGHFQQLVRELRERRRAGEPVYVFARSLPAWIYYSTDWSHPDTLRVGRLIRAASAGGAAFENTPSRGRIDDHEADVLRSTSLTSAEILGLPSGMEWREVQGHVRSEPDSGWVEIESRRIRSAATPGIWVIASSYYAGETGLFRHLEHAASRRTFAHLRSGSALIRYEFTDRSSMTEPKGGLPE
jgi:dolichyl-phosphate-mannose-protein mannosyltransferase